MVEILQKNERVPKHVDPPEEAKESYSYIFAMVFLLLVIMLAYFIFQKHYQPSVSVPAAPQPSSGYQNIPFQAY